MTSADTEAMMALQELLDERQRYQGWLTVLEGRRLSTPAHVYDRVHTDYSLRLERVIERLSERAEQLASAMNSLTTRLNTLRARESDRMDARHEAELRAVVGEYGAEEWERLRGSADRELGEIASERQGVESELAEMERIVALTRPSAPIEEAEDNALDGNAATVAEPDAIAAASELTEESSPYAADVNGGHVEVTRSIDDFVAEWPVKQGGGSGAREAEAASGRRSDGVAEATEVDAEVAAGPAHVTAGMMMPPQSGRSIGTAGTPSARAVPPPVLGDTRRESEKTLKCPECGVMNYATEWYCERCGGELSTF